MNKKDISKSKARTESKQMELIDVRNHGDEASFQSY